MVGVFRIGGGCTEVDTIAVTAVARGTVSIVRMVR